MCAYVSTSTCMWLLVLGGAVGAVVLIVFVLLVKMYAKLTMGRCRCPTKMTGKTVLVTGPTGGIGKETVKELADRGARVILACRNVASGEKVKEEITSKTGNDNVTVMKLDLGSMKSVREFAAEVNKNERELHVLVHNAGTAETKETVTEDGLELTMATNHFGPFLLTHLLIDLLKRSAPSRIVIVASSLYPLALTYSLKNMNPVNCMIPSINYYNSKYANIQFCSELARRLDGTGVTANCLHPGMIDSGIWRNVPFPLDVPTRWFTRSFFKTPKQGCQTTVQLCVDETLEQVTGKYFSDCKQSYLWGKINDANRARKMWDVSEKLVKLTDEEKKICAIS